MTLSPETVVYTTNKRFWPHVFVSLYSLLKNNPDVAFDVRVIATEPDHEFFEHVRFLRTIHPSFDVSWLPIEPKATEDAPTGGFSSVSYYRLFLGSLLPSDVSTLQYLDADTIIRGSLKELFELNMGDAVLAATPEFVPEGNQGAPTPHPVRLGLPETALYFNSGVLRINLDQWRQENIERQSLDRIAQNRSNLSRFMYPDQDVLNAVLAGRWLPIGPSYNFQDWSMDPRRARFVDPETQTGGVIPPEGPLIAHLTGASPRPWEGLCRHPYGHEYWQYRMETPYRNRYVQTRRLIVGPLKELRNGVVKRLKRTQFGRLFVSVARRAIRGV